MYIYIGTYILVLLYKKYAHGNCFLRNNFIKYFRTSGGDLYGYCTDNDSILCWAGGEGVGKLAHGNEQKWQLSILVLEALQFTTVCKMHTAFVVMGTL